MNIRTSKTRSMYSPSDRSKAEQERSHRLREKHMVHTATPVGGLSMEELEKELDEGGSKMRDMMQEKRGQNMEEADRKAREKHSDTVANMDSVKRRKMAEKQRRR